MTSKSAAAISCQTVLSICGLISCLLGQTQPKPIQRGFETAQAAADALIQAAEVHDVAALASILGPDGEDLIASADPVQDKNRSVAFAAKARQKKSVSMDENHTFNLTVGDDDWPLPIPIVRKKGKWYFDTKAGREEILLRRIGANELDAIAVCRGFVEAQHQYATEKRSNLGANQYAQRIISTPGKKDGLYWQNEDGTSGGPISNAVARAIEEGYSNKSAPFHGYYFKVLKGQGPAAHFGQLDFVVNGAMIGGFALVAAPAEYRVTGVKTFIVSHDGVVYQKDLGRDSLKVFQKMDRFNPDKTWQRTDDEW